MTLTAGCMNSAKELCLGHNLFCGWLFSVLLHNFMLIPFSWILIFCLPVLFLKQLNRPLLGLKTFMQHWFCSSVLERVTVPLPNPEVNRFTESDHIIKFWHLANQLITFIYYLLNCHSSLFSIGCSPCFQFQSLDNYEIILMVFNWKIS